MNRFEKRAQAILGNMNLVSYREDLIAGFVEFWITDEIPGPYLTMKQLKKLSKLFGTEKVTITGGDLGATGCMRCNVEEPAVYLVFEGIDS